MQVGGAIGLALLATLASERTDGLRADGESVASALTGYHLAYVVGAVLVAAAFVAALTVLRSDSRRGPRTPTPSRPTKLAIQAA